MHPIILSLIGFLIIALAVIGVIICRVDKIQRDDWNTPNDNDPWDK